MTRGLSHCIISNFLRVYMTSCLTCTKPVDQSNGFKWLSPLSAQRSSDIFTCSRFLPTNVPVPFAQATGSKTRFVCTVHVCESSQFEPFKFKFYRAGCMHLCTAKSAYSRKATFDLGCLQWSFWNGIYDLCALVWWKVSTLRGGMLQSLAPVTNKTTTYCWWKKSCTTGHVWNPVNNG